MTQEWIIERALSRPQGVFEALYRQMKADVLELNRAIFDLGDEYSLECERKGKATDRRFSVERHIHSVDVSISVSRNVTVTLTNNRSFNIEDEVVITPKWNDDSSRAQLEISPWGDDGDSVTLGDAQSALALISRRFLEPLVFQGVRFASLPLK